MADRYWCLNNPNNFCCICGVFTNDGINSPIPVSPRDYAVENESNSSQSLHESDDSFEVTELDKPHLIKQDELSDLRQHLNLPQDKLELLASHLQ